jgi:hypothetical protein
MGGLFGGGSSSKKSTSSSATNLNAVKGPYPDDNAKRMPVYNSPSAIEAGRRKRREIMARSGRSSTRLVSDAGVRPYQGSLLGNTT